MKTVREVIVVEGKYDAIRLHSAVQATVLETAGFGIFKDREQLALLRRMAKTRGLLVLTDSDSAGFMIRNFLNGAIPAEQVKHAYIPEIYGKERRKETVSQEGLLGVEGMDNAVIIEALRRAGATFEEEPTPLSNGLQMTKTDLFTDGLVGGANSAVRRRLLLQQLHLPVKMSANRLLQVLNLSFSETEYREALQAVNAQLPVR